MMAEWFVYLTKCSICLCVLYGFCKCLCAGSTLFGFHRKVMLWGVAVCLCLPLGKWTTEWETGVQRPLQVWSGMLAEAWPETPDVAEGQTGKVEVRLMEKDGAWNWNLLPWIYWAGAVAAFLFYGLCYVRLWRLLRRGERVRGEGWTAILTDEPVESFSVGRFVVMNREDYCAFPLIRLHEQMHVRLRHAWDEVLMQAFTVLFWFHPLAWLLRKDLREQHEFQADEGVLQQGIDAKTYQLLLVRKSVGAKRLAMASGFCHCSLKKRVTMMLKKRTNGWRRTALLLALPLAGGTAWLFARPEMNVPQLQEMVAARETAEEAPADTVRPERRYVEVKDGPEVYDVLINHKGEVFLDPWGSRYGRKGEEMWPDKVEEALSVSLVKHFASLQKTFKTGKVLTIRISTRVETKEEDLLAVEKAVREGIRSAAKELSRTHSDEEMQPLLKVNMVYNKPRSFNTVRPKSLKELEGR